ncbi:MAG: DUF4290 domain-containing protein [Bacteroidales bacterium]|nr:DUF4290 domain-containing protein [Bacteroidales bacterium]
MDYNTQREKLVLPEYGRHVQKMIEQVKAIEDKEKRSEQMRAVVQVMGILNPQIRELSDYKHKLWDHAQVIGGFELDIDAPYPAPTPQQFETRPDIITLPDKPVKAACYGRNIENIIDLIAAREDDEMKKEMIRSLALYMRQQYLIWNKDNVAEETIFADIERLSDGRLKVPADVHLGAISQSANYSRPGISVGGNNGAGFSGGNGNKKNRNWKRKK